MGDHAVNQTRVASPLPEEPTVGVFVASASTDELARLIDERAGSVTNLAVLLGVAAGGSVGSMLGSVTGELAAILLLMVAGGFLGFIVGRSAGGAVEAGLRLVARGRVVQDPPSC